VDGVPTPRGSLPRAPCTPRRGRAGGEHQAAAADPRMESGGCRRPSGFSFGRPSARALGCFAITVALPRAGTQRSRNGACLSRQAEQASEQLTEQLAEQLAEQVAEQIDEQE